MEKLAACVTSSSLSVVIKVSRHQSLRRAERCGGRRALFSLLESESAAEIKGNFQTKEIRRLARTRERRLRVVVFFGHVALLSLERDDICATVQKRTR